uniref:Amino acid transporter transmembrane domain-containing protein n=1 Tax=Ditylenchus dipsaci TaxID=166011 RepID=A0A915CZZ7_9BILA
MVDQTDTAGNPHSYSTFIGLLYVFNLIVGTGALALPRAFQTAGYALSVVMLMLSAFASYVSATFIVECLSIANALLKSKPSMQRQNSSTATRELSSSEESLIALPSSSRRSNFDITRRLEVSELATMFLGRIGVFFTYLALTVYLFGDLAIYSTTVPKSLMNVICSSVNATLVHKDVLCHPGDYQHFTRFFVYRICVVAFASLCLPMVLVGMTKTKYLQLATTLSRWSAFTLMIALASIQLIQKGPQAAPPAVELRGFGSLFGVAVYAFMCHHSIPGLITPMRNKQFVNYRLIFVYATIFLFYCTLSITGSFAFPVVQDVYTLNFLHDDQTGWFYIIFDYFLALFPVFTLTSSYIIVAITLTNNVRVLISMLQSAFASTTTSFLPNQNVERESDTLLTSSSEDDLQSDNRHERLDDRHLENSSTASSPPSPVNISQVPVHIYAPTLAQRLKKDLVLPAFVILLPTTLSFFTDNVLLLASITGSYPGVAVQFMIPAILTIGGRSYLKKTLRIDVPKQNASPFTHWMWPWVVIGWAMFAIIVVSTNILHLG